MKYKIFVDDNFHYMDESHRYKLGEYDNLEKAIAGFTSMIDIYEPYFKGSGVESGFSNL